MHGLTRYRQDGGRWRCVACHSKYVAAARLRNKMVIVTEHGGQCLRCGYSKCLRALEFHHVDPTQKHFTLAKKNWACSLSTLRKETDKCILLCSNCHSEVEDEQNKMEGQADDGLTAFVLKTNEDE